jgi:hypothetical protein
MFVVLGLSAIVGYAAEEKKCRWLDYALRVEGSAVEPDDAKPRRARGPSPLPRRAAAR